MKKILSAALLGLLLVGCTKEKNEDHSLAIKFGSAIDVSLEAKAASRSVVENTTVLSGVTFLRKDGTVAPTDLSGAAVLTADRATNGDISFTTTPAPIYALNDDNAFFVAHYPAGVVASEVVTWTIDGKTDILLTPIYDAGKYSVPVTGVMNFTHQLAQLAVVCQADPASTTLEEAVQAAWGKITKIELMDTPTERTYTYATNAVGDGATLGALSLLQSDYETTFADVAITKNPAPNAVVTAAGMFVPASTGVAPLKLKVYTEKEPTGQEVTVQLKDGTTADKGFEMGKRHTVTLVFKASDKDIKVLATTIEPWATGYSGTGELTK